MSKSIDVKKLGEICEIPGAPGFEQRIRERVIQEVKPHVDELTIDNMGNVVAVIKGKSDKKVMLGAHMDEIGFMVTHIDDQGFLRFHTLGGFDPKTLTAQRVIVHGRKDLVGVMGSKPIHVMSPEERRKPAETKAYFIDLGMPAEEVKKWVRIGDPVTRERQMIQMGDCVNCKSIDNRVSVFILIELLQRLKNPPVDVYGVFTVQEEVGVRGASVSALNIHPDFGIGLDTTIAFDTPGAPPHEQVTRLGEGVAIKVMDASTICDYRMVNFMRETAEKADMKYQMEVLTAGGTDTMGIQRMVPGGSIAGAISIPTRHIHQVIEMAHTHDIALAIDLAEACIMGLDQYDWSHTSSH